MTKKNYQEPYTSNTFISRLRAQAQDKAIYLLVTAVVSLGGNLYAIAYLPQQIAAKAERSELDDLKREIELANIQIENDIRIRTEKNQNRLEFIDYKLNLMLSDRNIPIPSSID